MIADLYISNESFAWNGVDSDKEIAKKVLLFCNLVTRIRQFPAHNTVYVNYSDNLVSVKLNEAGVTLSQIVSDRDCGRLLLGRDLYDRFLSSFNGATQTSFSNDEMMELLEVADDNLYHGLLVLNIAPGIPKSNQVLSTIPEWLALRRFLLERYSKTGIDYLTESRMCFPILEIHPDNASTLDSLIKTHVCGVTKCLIALNDFFFDDLKSFVGTHPIFMSHFGSSRGLDGSSFEGTGDDKFYKVFPDKARRYCEPHLKMNKSDCGKEGETCRVYFEFPLITAEKIYVGYICEHL